MTIAALGTPRILFSDATTAARLRGLMQTKAASATRFKSYVDSQLAGADNYLFDGWHAALVSQTTGNASYCDYAVSFTDDFVKSEEALIAQNQKPQVASDHYLDIGPIVGNLALVYDWCRPQMTDDQRARWRDYGNQAVWNLWNFQDAKWGNTAYPDTGWAVDDPEDNYYYSFLRATMLLGLATYGENDMAAGWLDKFRVEKFGNQLVPAFNADLQGGGSREGTGYGVSLNGLFDLYYLWEKSTGERIADFMPHTLASLDKAMHDIVPTLDRIAPTGDHSRDSTASLFDYHRTYLLALSALYPNDPSAGIAKSLLAQSSVPQMQFSFDFWSDFIYDQSSITAQPIVRLATAHWSPGTGQFSTRSTWGSTDAGYVNFICGPYTQSHAHQDQGSFVFYKGSWLAYDENIASHSGLMQMEEAHNLVRVENNGQSIDQNWGASCSMQALADTPAYSYALANVSPMYAGTGVTRMEREFVFLKPSTIVVLDRVQTSGTGMKRIWTLNVPGTPAVSGDSLTAQSDGHELEVVRLAPSGLTTQLVSWPSLSNETSFPFDTYFNGTRIEAADTAGSSTVFLHVLSADHGFSSAVRSDATGQTGAQVTLADGSVAIVRFSTSGTGGTLDLRSPAGSVVFSGALPSSVQTPARLAN